jgi:hypothetical protein
MNRKLFKWGLILIWCLNIAPDVFSQTNVQSSTIKDMDSKLDNIMILHLGEIYDTRKTVEGEITFWLNKYKFSASPSNRYFDHQRIPTKDQIIKVLNENGFDGILTTVFTDIETKERFENPQAAYNLTPTSPTIYNFLDSYQNKYSTGYTIQEKAFIVHSKLFKTSDESVLYEASTETYQPQSLDAAVENFSKSIAKELKKSKVLEKK